jgi:hypothetical protein
MLREQASYAESRNILQGPGFNSSAPGAGQGPCLRAITVRRRDRFWGRSRPFSRAAENVSFGRFRTLRKINRARPKVKEETKALRGAPPFGAASPFVGLCALFLSEHGLDLYGSFALPEIKASSDKSGQHRVVRLMRARFRPLALLCAAGKDQEHRALP